MNTFRAFRSNNYRLYFSGQSISLMGTWMQRTAVYWLIYIETHSAFMLGLAVFVTQFPSFLFSPLGGIVSDRYNRYRVLLTTQIASMVQATLLMALVTLTHYKVWEIFFLSGMLGTINGFDVPARQSLVHDMVERTEDLPNAIALNSSMVNLARLIGPAVSGVVLEKWGSGTCFLINALSFVSVIVSLLLMRFPRFVPRVNQEKITREFGKGWKYLRGTPSIGFVILMLACTSLFVIPFSTLLPVYAKVIFRGNASTFGYLNSFIGLGAIAGTFFLASLKASVNLNRMLLINLALFGLGLILFSHVARLPLALVFCTLAGFGMMSQTTLSNTLVQTLASPEMRGRAISYFAMAFFGMQPVGGLLVGTISHYVGAPGTIMAEGVAAILIALLFMPLLGRHRDVGNSSLPKSE